MPTVNDWAQQQWSKAALGDQRRTRRAVALGAEMAARPAAGLPGQTQSWADLKAAYRLLHEDDVTHAALSSPHWRQTRDSATQAHGPVLFVQDGSQLDFTMHDAKGLGRIGDERGRGILIHSTLALLPGDPVTVLGLAHQLPWVRDGEPHKPRETRSQRARRSDRESAHWFSVLEAIGRVPDGACWVSVGDRESDIFAYWEKARELGWECLLRLAHSRRILREDDSVDHLFDWARQLSSQACQPMALRTRPDRAARTAVLSMAWAGTRVLAPRNDPALHDHAPLPVWVLRVWEDTVPAGEPPLEWLLLSTLPIENAAQARERADWYRHRWIIEQYHKALKTGCGMEQSQLHDAHALTRLLGLLSIVAVHLLQVETLARSVPDLPASQAVDWQLLEFLCRLRQMDPANMTVYQFWREVAKLGGFLARKRDGEPGWQTLWRGWHYLYPRFEGYLLAQKCG